MVDSKNKGSGYERKIVKLLTKWTGEKHQRTPGSGSWSSIHKREDLSGDITCSNPNFIFSIECKKYKTFNLESLILSDKSIIWSWWQQCVNQTPVGKLPLLIFSKNHSEDFCMVNESYLIPINSNYFEVASKYEKVYIFKLKDLLETDPKKAFSP